jgi:adenylate cyclase class 2
MVQFNRENEIKLAFSSAQTAVARLLAAGARPVKPRAFEDNVLFDFADRSLLDSGRLLRLREWNGSAWLTFKAPAGEGHRHKVRVEHEVSVSDPGQMRSILAGLGFSPSYRYQKFRSTYELVGVEAAVDETPIGTFIELEGAPAEVDRAAEALGAKPSDFIRETYRELQERDAAARGMVAGDMLL